MGVNYEIKNLRNNLLLVMNQSFLPIEVKRLILFEIYNETKIVSDTQISVEEKEIIEKSNAKESSIKDEIDSRTHVENC